MVNSRDGVARFSIFEGVFAQNMPILSI